MMTNRIAFGGGCHWCTEAIFQSLRGVTLVKQGWIASKPPNDAFSEGVIVHYSDNIDLATLVEVHLLTHSSTSLHSKRQKYRSAVYYFDVVDKLAAEEIIKYLESENKKLYITQVLPFVDFRQNTPNQLNYYRKNKQGSFCQTYIDPKLAFIREKFGSRMRNDL